MEPAFSKTSSVCCTLQVCENLGLLHACYRSQVSRIRPEVFLFAPCYKESACDRLLLF